MSCVNQIWRKASAQLRLPSNEIHIWKVVLDGDSVAMSSSIVNTPLSDEEIARANRFHFERDRRRFAHSHISLRQILARYLRLQPKEIHFSASNNGRPEVVPQQNHRNLQFNLSHSGSFAIVGVTLSRRIGVDVECYRSLQHLEIANRYFSSWECRELNRLPSDDLEKNFFACWTRKEAFLKATGEGIGTLLSQVSVTVAHSEVPQLREFQPNPSETQRWSLMDIPVQDGYAAAMAFENGPVEVRYWDFEATEGEGSS
jgi:4'-phosphopantetheinyl transferase